jgi:hypothetical protein
LDFANVAIDVRIGAPEPLLPDLLLAGIVGGCHKPELSLELQIR